MVIIIVYLFIIRWVVHIATLHGCSSILIKGYILSCFEQFIMKASLLKLVKFSIPPTKITQFSPLKWERGLWSRLGMLQLEQWRLIYFPWMPIVDQIYGEFLESFFCLFQVGEVVKITCQPEYAYGSAGSPPDIPPK